MEFKVGSLANLISGKKSPAVSTDSKLFDNVGEGKKVNIKFQAVQNHKKEKVKRKSTEAVQNRKKEKVKRKTTEDNFSLRQNKKQKLTNEIDAEPVAIKSNAVCAVKRLRNKKKKEVAGQSKAIIEEREARTIFVGNVPIDITRKKLKKRFYRYGEIETIRIRCPPLADPRVPKKVAVIKRNFHCSRNSIHAFVRFVDIESVQRALEANGTVYEQRYIRVDTATRILDHDQKRAVFVGNVPFAAEEDDLWKMFQSCGNISGVRLVRDGKTGIGKGFGYVNFETAHAVELALRLNGQVLNKRKLRVTRSVKKTRKMSGNRKGKTFGKNRNQELKKSFSKTKSNEEEGKGKDDDDKQDVVNVPVSDERSKKAFTKFQPQFQGQKIAEDNKLGKKKKKKNKAELKKKVMIRKLAPKSQSAIKKVKKPVLKTKSLAKKIKAKPSRK